MAVLEASQCWARVGRAWVLASEPAGEGESWSIPGAHFACEAFRAAADAVARVGGELAVSRLLLGGEREAQLQSQWDSALSLSRVEWSLHTLGVSGGQSPVAGTAPVDHCAASLAAMEVA